MFPEADTQSGIELVSALSSTSRIAIRLKYLQDIVKRSTGVDERENLTNGLGELGELYEKDWASDSDLDDD